MRTKMLLLCLAVLAVTLGACASGGAGAAPAAPPPIPDDQQIQGVLAESLAKLTSGDIEGMMTLYTDDFTSAQGNKEGMAQFLTMAKDQGLLDGFTSNTDAVAITVAGETATATGIVVEGAFGVLNLTFGLAKRDGKWMITSQEQQ